MEKEKIIVELDSDTLDVIERTGGVPVKQFVEYAVDQTLAHELDKRDGDLNWYYGATSAAQKLIDKIGEFEDLFSDMLFRPGTITHDFIACSIQEDDGSWADWDMGLPDELEYFTYTWFTFSVEKLPGDTLGKFDLSTQTMTIDPESMDNDAVLLHELIHLHESVIDSLPLFYHEVYLLCSYRDLSKKISDLDERIMGHGHIFNEHSLSQLGGVHDLLFLLKSFDLDLRKGYPLGTVFGYGMAEGA